MERRADDQRRATRARKSAYYFTEEEIKQLVADTKKAAETDNTLKKFLLEMIYGKAPQALEIDTPPD